MSSRRIVLIGLLLVALATGAAVGLLFQKIASPPLSQSIAVGALVGVVGFLAVCAVGGYTDNWTWTGFGPSREGKTLWDAVQVLILPAVLAFGAVFLDEWQKAGETIRADKQATVTALNTDRKAAVTALNTLNQTRDGVLDDYMSKISNLILHENLSLATRTSASCLTPAADDVQNVVAIARARTLTALQRLDSARQTVLVRFLVESKLIPAVSLSIVDLRNVNLSGIDLSCAQLQYARLSSAYLSYTNLSNADLSNADLSGVHWYHTTCPDSTNSATNSPQSCEGHLQLTQ